MRDQELVSPHDSPHDSLLVSDDDCATVWPSDLPLLVVSLADTPVSRLAGHSLATGEGGMACDEPTVSDDETVVELDDELDATEVTECDPLFPLPTLLPAAAPQLAL